MARVVIQVENLSKKYVLRHQNAQFATLKDSIMEGVGNVGRRLRGKPIRMPTREEFWALKDVAFEIRRGDRVGIIGRNGAGKSTLLKIISRITEPTTGRIAISGRVASLLEVGTGFHPELTGRENIFLNGAILGMTRGEIRRKFDEIVAFAECAKFLDTPVKRYSSGMYVRLAFAVAANLDPEILIVDEVLSVGDAEFQKKCLGKMQDVSTDQGRTVFFVSHNMAAVQSLCTQALFMQQGRIMHAGPAAAVIDQYLRHGGTNQLEQASAQGKDFDLCGLSARSEDGSPLYTFRPALIEIAFRPHHAVIDAGVHILLEDMNGSPVMGLDSRDFVERTPAAPGQTIRCVFRLQALPLLPGPYRLRLWLKSEVEHLAWEVPQMFELSVEEAAVYGARQIQRKWHGTTAAAAAARMELV